jgi:hypothetical protein
MWMEESIGKQVNIERSQELLATGASRIATACPFCYVMIDDGVKAQGVEEGQVKVGDLAVASRSAAGLPAAEVKAVRAGVEAEVKAALAKAGYPAKADPARINMAGVLGVMMVFVIAATALFGPIAACLVELFPTRVRYTAMSLPYHIGTGWIGGFVPFFAYAIVIGVGNIYSGLWYPFAFTLLSVVTCILFLPETRGRRLDA